ncbi:MAG: alpha/beta hydrolase [Pseudobutyrivibrio ruminis]|nr:alpha/beta hydrolase [Pseudobutyrivibrio ruminis]
MNNKNKKRIVVIIVFAIIVFAVFGFFNYVDDYYKATDRAWSYINEPAEGVTVSYVDNTIVFEPEEPVAGFIFYPGGLVETEAYAPLMEQLAEQGIFGVVVEMPYYLAMLDANGARGIQAKYPEIEDWYIGGHSLGGAMACLYANRHQSEYEGLILLAAYSTKDLSDEPEMDTLLVRGSEDQVLNIEKYNKYLSNLPKDYQEVVIDGGCHGYFGDYGMQAGDGEPAVTVEEQTYITVDKIVEFIGRE